MIDKGLYREVVVVGANHYNTLWLLRALGMAGFTPTIIIVGRKKEKSFVCKSKYVKSCFSVFGDKELIDLLVGLKFEQRTVVLTMADVYAKWLDKAYDTLTTKYILNNCDNKQGGIIKWMDKESQMACAKECSLSVPYSEKYDLFQENDYSKVKYPVLIKPEFSTDATKAAFRICYNEIELDKALNEIKKLCNNVLVQEYIKHDNEYLMCGVSLGDEVIIPGGDYKLITCSDVKNMGMHTFGYVSANHPSQFHDIERVKKMVRNMKYKGLFSVELMLTNDNYYFLEINMRNDGTSYITTQAGVNLPAIWTAYCYGYDLSIFPTSFKRERTYGLNGANYIKYGLKKVSLFETLKNFFITKAFSIYKHWDVKPLIFKVLYK